MIDMIKIVKSRYHRLVIDDDKLVDLFTKYEINTVNRLSGFISQCAHESGDFRIKVENLNYSSDGLLRVFKKYFTPESASVYARKPEMIASRVYANRMGNGDESSKDGWKFRGRGYIQLTGRNNYTNFANSIDMSVEDVVEYLDQDEGSLHSALWYWDKNNLNRYCDGDDVKSLTKAINGGYHGLDDRNSKYEELKSLLS